MKIIAPELKRTSGIYLKEFLASFWLGLITLFTIISYIPTLGWSYHFLGKEVNSWYRRRLEK